MKRRKFIKSCCYTTIGITLAGSVLQSCGSIYYSSVSSNANRLVIAKSEFWYLKKDKKVNRAFVLIKPENSKFPICIYKIKDDTHIASLLKCTHRACELNVGGGIYSCPPRRINSDFVIMPIFFSNTLSNSVPSSRKNPCPWEI